MKKKLILSIGLTISLLATEYIPVQTGWQLVGTSSCVQNMEPFDKASINTVWTFDKNAGQWKVFTTNTLLQAALASNSAVASLNTIEANQGFWIYAFI